MKNDAKLEKNSLNAIRKNTVTSCFVSNLANNILTMMRNMARETIAFFRIGWDGHAQDEKTLRVMGLFLNSNIKIK